jgi:hypothetical protein
MVDHDKQQILQKLEDDALANARQKAQDDAKAELRGTAGVAAACQPRRCFVGRAGSS